MLTAVATKSLKIVIFNHLVLVDDSVTIPRCPNLVVDLKVSVALQKNFARLRTHFGHPLIQILDPPLRRWCDWCISTKAIGVSGDIIVASVVSAAPT